MGPIFWLKMILVIVIITFLTYILTELIRRWLKVEKKKMFSPNHVNDMHKKIDWTLRIVFLAVLLVYAFYIVERGFSYRIWFLEPWFILFISIIVTESVRAFMEWKYAENKKNYIFTLCQLALTILIVITALSTNFFGMFSFEIWDYLVMNIF